MRGHGGLKTLSIVGLLGALLPVAAAQSPDRRPNPMLSSDLSRENLSRVAASAQEIKTILVKDRGLMVELKRWVAREATNKGQYLTATNLTDEAIYDRLQSDVRFRSVATTMVQRYGYLVPQVNPESAVGKEQELLAKERAKWLAQNQEQQAEQARRRGETRLQRSQYCGQQNDAECEEQNYPEDRRQAPGQPRLDQREQEFPPSQQMGPGQSNPSNAPRSSGGAIERTQLGEDGLGGGLSDLPLGGSAQSAAMLDGVGISG